MVTLNLNPDRDSLRQFGLIAMVAFSLIAAMAWTERFMFAGGLGSARPATASVLIAIGVLSAVLSLICPHANRPLYVVLMVVTYPIGFIVSHLILGALFFGIFAPAGLILRLVGRDPLQRRSVGTSGSYWAPAPPRRPRESYFRQY